MMQERPLIEPIEANGPGLVAREIGAQIRALPVRNVAAMRRVVRSYSRRLRTAETPFMFAVAQALLDSERLRWIAYEVLRGHRATFASIGETQLEELGRGIDSWDTVDSFARTLAGPAWLEGQVSDRLMQKWAQSQNPWWRRAALVSTVALNLPSQGGYGDAPRTLAICNLLADDRDDMVVKAMSWALRALVRHQPQAVRDFVSAHHSVLAARVEREVGNKLATGLKNPRSKSDLRRRVV